MSTKINDGGPAFPKPYGVEHVTSGGMSLRAYFAGQAPISALEISDSVRDAEAELGLNSGEYTYADHYHRLVAKKAVQYADALIAELNKPTEAKK
jgi:hypothetical protein